METIIQTESAQLSELTATKLKTWRPFLAIIAAENRFRLKGLSGVKKAYTILQRSILNN